RGVIRAATRRACRVEALGGHARGHLGQPRLVSRVAPAARIEIDLDIHHRNGGTFHQENAGAAGLRPLLHRNGCHCFAPAQQQCGARPGERGTKNPFVENHGLQAPYQWRRPGGGVRGLRLGSTGWGRRMPTVSWSSPKYLAATALTCSAVMPRRRWISRSPASSGSPWTQSPPSSRAWFMTESSL